MKSSLQMKQGPATAMADQQSESIRTVRLHSDTGEHWAFAVAVHVRVGREQKKPELAVLAR